MAITLKAARVNAGMTLAEAAARIGISMTTLSKWENDVTYPTVKNIKKIEDVYNVTYNDIFFGA